jgi:hypothetical protein
MNGLVPYARANAFSNALVPYQQSQVSNLAIPQNKASSLRDWWREIQGGQAVEPSTPVQSAVVGLRQNAEGAAIGALLAFIDTDLGGLDLGGRIPIDWAGAALFYALSIHGSDKPEGLALDYRAMGQSCSSIAMYRTVHKWREAKKGIPQNKPQLVGDPILKASNKLKSVAF